MRAGLGVASGDGASSRSWDAPVSDLFAGVCPRYLVDPGFARGLVKRRAVVQRWLLAPMARTPRLAGLQFCPGRVPQKMAARDAWRAQESRYEYCAVRVPAAAKFNGIVISTRVVDPPTPVTNPDTAPNAVAKVATPLHCAVDGANGAPVLGTGTVTVIELSAPVPVTCAANVTDTTFPVFCHIDAGHTNGGTNPMLVVGIAGDDAALDAATLSSRKFGPTSILLSEGKYSKNGAAMGYPVAQKAPMREPAIAYSADGVYLVVSPGVESGQWKHDNPIVDNTSTQLLALQTGTNRFIVKTAPAGPIVPSSPLDYAEFFALMPGDNAAPVAINAPILFPQNGPTAAGGITRLGAASFQLAAVGTYEVSWQASVTEPAQALLWVDTGVVVGVVGSPAKILRTVVGRATGTNQISGRTLITTGLPNTAISVRNGASAAAITMTPIAGGTDSVSANLVIRRLA